MARNPQFGFHACSCHLSSVDPLLRLRSSLPRPRRGVLASLSTLATSIRPGASPGKKMGGLCALVTICSTTIVPLGVHNGGGGTRTLNFLLAGQVLSQLSYAPNGLLRGSAKLATGQYDSNDWLGPLRGDPCDCRHGCVCAPSPLGSPVAQSKSRSQVTGPYGQEERKQRIAQTKSPATVGGRRAELSILGLSVTLWATSLRALPYRLPRQVPQCRICYQVPSLPYLS